MEITVCDMNWNRVLPAIAVCFSLDRSLALHKNLENPNVWNITHMPTGLSVATGILNRDEAERALDEMAKMGGHIFRKIRQTKNNKTPTPLARKLCAMLKPLMLTVPMHFRPHYWR